MSLPKNIDEINFSMTNKFIDLIAFNETRLDENITNNMNNYDIVRKGDQETVVGFVFTCVAP